MTLSELILSYRTENNLSQRRFAELCDLSNGYISMLEKGKNPKTNQPITPTLPMLKKLAKGLNLSINDLFSLVDDIDIVLNHGEFSSNFLPPNTTNDYATFPVVGEIAAGYDSIALESWEGETVDIPLSYLKGRELSEFFVLKVKGDSMYPIYMEDDKVLILKQPTLSYSGQVGAILYDGELATLKKVEFIKGKNWMKLVPINPNHPPKLIENEELERCKVIGVPKLLIRNIE